MDFRTFLENMKMSSSLLKILETGINMLAIAAQMVGTNCFLVNVPRLGYIC